MTPIEKAEIQGCELPTVIHLIDRVKQVVYLCGQHGQPGKNIETHNVCYEILKILGEREDGR